MNLTKKLIELRATCISVIRQLVNYYGIDSELQGDKCLRILDDDFKYNLRNNIDGRRYLTEVTETALFDNRGYSHFPDVLGTEKLCDLTMYLVNAWDRKNIIEFSEDKKDAALAMAWDYLSRDMSHRPDFNDVITCIRKARK